MKTARLVLLIGFIFCINLVFADIINVPVDQSTIQAGINAASNGDTVLVQPGTYYENINYNGKLITIGSLFLTTQDSTYTFSTIIDGTSGSVVTIESGEDLTAVLCGFSITDGDGNGSLTSFGGGIYCRDSSPTIKNLVIFNNYADIGGGIYSDNSSMILSDINILNNSAIISGGLDFYESNPRLSNVIINGNTASDYGGGVKFVGLAPELLNVTITNNSANTYGGGIICSVSSPILKNVTISDNYAGTYGGGIYCYDSNPSIENTTIANNSASSSGGGIYSVSSNANILNSILWDNSPQEIMAGSITVTYSDIQGGWAGTGNIDSDPLFIDPLNNDYHLHSNSPCINAGDPLSPLDPDGSIADMGAYYVHISPYSGPVWHISTAGTDLGGNGSGEFPFATIQHGIDISSSTDTVLVHPGTYVENINFSGKLITVASLNLTTRDTAYISSTIIDGDGTGSVVTLENNEDSTAALCGFTITNGSSNGGGIFCDNYSSPSLLYLMITDNSATVGGGIYCNDNSNPSLQNVTISGNSANVGAGVYCLNSSSPSLNHVLITGNSAISGGGIACSNNSNPSLQNVTIADNTISNDGGGIYCTNSFPNLLNSILWNNSTPEIYESFGSVTATYSDIEGGWVGTGNIVSDPLFVDPTNGGYYLQPASPCINTGDPDSQYDDPDGTIADMGAYFYNQYTGPIWYISTTGSDISGSGTEQHPFGTIQHGINYSDNTDTILVYPGTYIDNIDYNGKLIIVGSLFLTTLDTSYIATTIIDGNNDGRVVTFENSEDSTAVLCGFTITNGYAYGGGSYGTWGGGIFCDGAGPSIGNLIVTGNTALGGGGGVSCTGYSLTPNFMHVEIINNSAGKGGGLYFNNSDPNLQNVSITGNIAVDDFSHGGGIYCYHADPYLENVLISDNQVNSYGGGIYCDYSNPILQNVILSNNSGYAGGGLYCTYSYPSLQNAIVSGNSVSNGGGGLYCETNASLRLNNVTVSDNSADFHAGIYCVTSSDSLKATNLIVWNNSPDEIVSAALYTSVTYSDIKGGYAGTGNIDSDPLFVDPANEVYHLLPGSPCIDAGDPMSPLDPDGTIADMGAFYFDQHFGSVWHISISGSDITGSGSEQNPFATIQHGIDVSSNTDTVLVHPGTYIENVNYNGKLVVVGSQLLTTQDTSYTSSTIIDGNAMGSVVTFNSGEDSTAVLCGFTVTNGDNNGGGIHCHWSSPRLKNIIISGNTGAFFGGGIYCNYCSPILQDVIISGNTDVSFGGGIYCQQSSPRLENVLIIDNTAAHAGGLYCGYSSNPNLKNVTISRNIASSNGGGIYCDESNPSMLNVVIADNTASLFGGGIYCVDNSNPILQCLTITGNSASIYGGGISCESSNPVVSNSILWDNLPTEIYLFSGSVTANYSDIQGGWAGIGNIDIDPLFVDPGIGGYHLQSGSPCIDAGDPASPLDPDGTTADIGAFYHHYSGPVWHVSTSGSDITGSGSEQNPFATIQYGIDFSSDTDTVLVHPGAYLENINFNGKLITLGSLFLTTQDTSYISTTIIDGNSSGTVVTFENGENETAILKGFTITNGVASTGGGIGCLYATSPGLEDLIVSNNFATLGGGIYCYYASPNLQNVTIANNVATANGGGINCNLDCFPSLMNVTMSGNSANFGGGIFSVSSNPVIINSILWNDSPQEIYIGSGAVTVSYSDIQGGWPGTGNISSDPLFVDPGNGNYNLQNNSPCIDAGDPTSPLDPDGTIADMGAYYHQYAGPVWHISIAGSDITGNGSEQFPYATIQHGINCSADTDTVLVQPGMYMENIDFSGKLITVGSLFLTTTYTSYISTTIIDGNSNGSVVSFTNGEGLTAVLYGFTILNGSDNFGGGIKCRNSSGPNLQNLVVKDNSANNGAGISCYNNSNPNIQNVIVSGNSSVNNGGGIYTFESSPGLQNVTIVGNSASYGGGISSNENSSISLINVTISDNSASDIGGGIECWNNANPDILNCILWNNSPQEIFLTTSSATVTYSDIEGGWAGTGNIDSDPVFWNPSNGDYHLQSGSPCINTGDPVFPLDPDGTIADMGAYYFVSSELNLKVFLQGPYNSTGMNIDLNSSGLIPTNQPYNISPWNYSGNESVTSIPAAVVDWILVELRDASDAMSATPATMVDKLAVFLSNDGSVVGLNGISNPRINNTINQQLFVVIRHRNHIDVMSAYPLVEIAGIYSYDFTTIDQAIGVDATIPLGAGAYGMYSGDANADGQIDELDNTGVWVLEAGGFDYLPSDMNLDGHSNNTDKNDFWWMNRGNGCQVPE